MGDGYAVMPSQARGEVPPTAPQPGRTHVSAIFQRPRGRGAGPPLSAVLAARAEVIILKDGYTLHGVRIFKEKTELFDKESGHVFQIDKFNGVTAIDDNARYVVFPTSLKQVADVAETNRFKDMVAYSPKHWVEAGHGRSRRHSLAWGGR